MKHWYTIYTKPNAEYKVASFLQNHGIEIFLPEVRIINSSVSKPSPKEIFFPCYIFVNICLETEGLSSLQWLPGVRNIVSFDSEPVMIPEYIINEIRQKLKLIDESGNRDSRESFKSGTSVRIISGPFRDMVGQFDRSTSSEDRVQILLEILGRLNRVQIDVSELEVASVNKNINILESKRPRRTRGRGRFIKVKT